MEGTDGRNELGNFKNKARLRIPRFQFLIKFTAKYDGENRF
ncbi:hypothetical protein SAMN00777080_2015 [Aquiflexum balticum DSM 16537]|uniref:Uncharacterized protein n=1 Tax=Aquiflexum balticum DSM 16537 TaxID=758820 RepID=A0A1W2H3C0_9BACT|nr:hypothetical protein SAMN00777080_2015 [Aquiflexum balticum DSM 16537]